MDLLGYEALAPGQAGELGSVIVEHDKALAFALAYDPQPFHLDEEAASQSPLGGLAASGWYTAGLMMRLMADKLLSGIKSMGSGEIRDLKWSAPVLVGDTLNADYRILGIRPSSRGDRGYVETAFFMVNQRGVTVFSFTCIMIVGR